MLLDFDQRIVVEGLKVINYTGRKLKNRNLAPRIEKNKEIIS